MMRQSKLSYWTLLRPKYCCADTGDAESADSANTRVARRESRMIMDAPRFVVVLQVVQRCNGRCRAVLPVPGRKGRGQGVCRRLDESLSPRCHGTDQT